MIRVHPALKTGALAAGVLSLAFVGVVGFAHTQTGRPLLAVVGPMLGMGQAHAHSGGGGCPFGFDRPQAGGEKDAARAKFAALHRGAGMAASRIALGFKLDQTSRAEVNAWAATHHLACSTPGMGIDLDCASVPAGLVGDAGGPPVTDLWFNFGSNEKLISVIAIRKDASDLAIESAFQATERALTQTAGAPTKSLGDPSRGYLAGGLLRQTSVEYAFSNYYAIARAANNGDGYILVEEYRSLSN